MIVVTVRTVEGKLGGGLLANRDNAKDCTGDGDSIRMAGDEYSERDANRRYYVGTHASRLAGDHREKVTENWWNKASA